LAVVSLAACASISEDFVMLRSALALLLLLLALPAAALPSGDVERTGDQVVIRWQDMDGPVRITMLNEADDRTGRLLLKAVDGGEAAVLAPVRPRPYFLLRDAKGQELRLGERLLPLAGGVNFRDLGGYRTDGGLPVAWGKLYRSAEMSGLTAADYRYVGDLGVATVCDFRANDERMRDPVNWPKGVKPKVLIRDYNLDMGALAAMFSGGPVTGEATRVAMAGFYRDLPFEFAPQFREMFAQLLKGDQPLAFNCSAGKDRTGLAAALILITLGVPRETVIADYLLSNLYYKPKPPKAGASPDPTAQLLSRMPADVTQALMGVDRRYIDASLAAIEAKGGMDRYMREELGLSASDVARLRKLYLAR
jgi:protein-tyrosine phosphatase